MSLNLKSEGEVLGRRVLWDRVDDDSKEEYISEVQMLIEPLLNGCYSDVHELGKEIELVSKSLVECGLNTLPLINGKKKRVWKDKQLSDLCENSRKARDCWKKAGRPRSGPLYEEKSRLRCEVRRRVRFCAGKAERLKIRKRDRLFETGHKCRFETPRKKTRCDRMMVNNEIVSDSCRSTPEGMGESF